MSKAQLEHSEVVLTCHEPDKCAGSSCTLHARSNHTMRSFPQHWRSDWGGFMERICPHGCGHPDPDELHIEMTHGCDGCCTGAYTTRTEEEDAALLELRKRNYGA